MFLVWCLELKFFDQELMVQHHFKGANKNHIVSYTLLITSTDLLVLVLKRNVFQASIALNLLLQQN